MTLQDWGIFLGLMAALTIITFTNLGYNFAPQTSWQPATRETALVDFGEVVEVSSFQFYMGHDNQRSFMIAASLDGQSWRTLYHSQRDYPVFRWNRINFEAYTDARFVEIIPFGTEGIRIMEAGFRGVTGQVLPIYQVSPGAEALFDEQHLIPERSSFMSCTYFDEVHYVRTGYEFIHGLPPGEVTHPPLGKVFQAISIAIFGMTPFAWRLPSVLFGLLMIPLIYAFARHLFKSNNWALFAAFVFSFDFMRFVQTRIATIDSYVTFFIIAMYFTMYMYVSGVKHRTFWKSVGLLLLCGASMGLAIASKWQGVYAAVGLPILFFPVWVRMYGENTRKALNTALICIVAFIILPFTIYALTYIPFVNSMGASDFGDAARIFWENQRFMLQFHGGLEAGHIYGSAWWSWPLMLTPFHYYAGVYNGLRVGIVALGNPAIWWFGIIAVAVLVFRLIKPKSKTASRQISASREISTPCNNYAPIFLLIGYAVQYLPWVFVSRVIFIYHYFPSVPFVVLIITWFFKTQAKKPIFAVGYALLVVGLFVMFHPVLSGKPVEWGYVSNWLWWVQGVVLN
jgi:dolichyl-phosphate-mannose--protein O-mannosyl transferase